MKKERNRVEEYEVLKTEVLIIGGGGAGVRAAIEADNQGGEVCLVSKGPLARSGITPMAFPSYQAAFGMSDPRDNPDIHYQDIVASGRGLSDQDLARILADESIPRALELEKFGVGFKKQDGKFFQVLHPGQTYPRNLFIMGAGFGLISGLKRELSRHPKVRVLEDFCVSRLLKVGGEVVGALGLNLRDGRFYAIEAKSVVLACGGYEELWGNTDTSPDSTGDGISLGFQAGADTIDLEMVQYYPTVFAYPESAKGLLIQYESLLSKQYFDFRLVNKEGKEFLAEGPLPVRDIMMRAMFTEIEEGRGTVHGAVWIDPSRSSKSKAEIDELMDSLLKVPDHNLRKLGINIREDRFEVCPAIHFVLGGIHINGKTETSVPGLFAAGENSSSLHGANRISGNALAETQVFGARAGRYATERAMRRSWSPLPGKEIKEALEIWNDFKRRKKEGIRPGVLKKEMKQIMDWYLGPNRTGLGMEKALGLILDLKRKGLPNVEVDGSRIFNVDWRTAVELAMSIELAELVIRSALFRKETRGHHFRSDCPGTSETPQHTLVIRKGNHVDVVFKPVRTIHA